MPGSHCGPDDSQKATSARSQFFYDQESSCKPRKSMVKNGKSLQNLFVYIQIHKQASHLCFGQADRADFVLML